MYSMTFKIKPDNFHVISAFASLSECLEFQKKTPIFTETDATFLGDCTAGAMNNISVSQSTHKVLRLFFSTSCYKKLY